MSFLSELKRRNVVRVAVAYVVTAWLVAQVAELAFDSFGSPDWVMKSLIFLLAIGLPIALLFAWAYELTPEGLKRDKDVDRSQSITHETGRKLNYAIIGVLVIALSFSIATHQWSKTDATDGDAPVSVASENVKSIAVLPFVNMSDDPSNEYFSDGISEELLNVLVKVDGLRVASRTSSFSFKDKDTPIPEIAEALNVNHVLEGSVRKAGDTVRVTAQLIDVRTDSHLWSETYDRKLEDIFVIQDEISAHIVDALRVALGTGEITRTSSQPTDDLAAYEDYLRGRHFWARRGGDNIRKAIDLFDKATTADPGFARAWSSLAVAHITMPTYSGEPWEDHFPKARVYAEKALGIDPSIAEAHAALGDLERYEKEWGAAESHYLQAIELEPMNATAYLWYSEHLASTGRVEKALEVSLKSLTLDPFSTGANSMAAYGYAATGDFNKSRHYTKVARELGHPGAIYFWLYLEIAEGNFDAAEAFVRENTAALGEPDTTLFELMLAALRDPDRVDAYFEFADSQYGPINIYSVIDCFRFGRIDEGIDRLRRLDANSSDLMNFWMPYAGPLRKTAAFADLLERDGLVAFWDEHGWPATCFRQGDQVTCH